MGKLDIDNGISEQDDFDNDQDVEQITSGRVPVISKDARRRLEDRLDDARLNRQLREYDYRDI